MVGSHVLALLFIIHKKPSLTDWRGPCSLLACTALDWRRRIEVWGLRGTYMEPRFEVCSFSCIVAGFSRPVVVGYPCECECVVGPLSHCGDRACPIRSDTLGVRRLGCWHHAAELGTAMPNQREKVGVVRK